MDRGLAVILTAACGGLIALQAPINAGLSKATDSLPAALISFAVGTLLLLGLVLVGGKITDVGHLTDARWYYLLGGALGAAYVFTVLVTVKTLGAGSVAAATITGQLTASVLIDQLGAFGLDKQPLTFTRIVGIALLLSGTYLIVR
jgi:bacterial/archaeal transporter family-2 protein